MFDPRNTATETPAPHVTPKKRLWARGIALLLLATAFLTSLFFSPIEWLNMETFRIHQSELTAWITTHSILAALAYVLLYTLLVLLLIPGPFFATLLGGFLFGAVAGTLLTALGATIGAILVFLVTKTAIGGIFQKWAGNYIHSFMQGFKKDELTYMFIFRLIPLFPFSIVTISAAALGVSFRVFFLATSVGILPAVYIVSLAGDSVASFVESGESFTLSKIFTLHGVAIIGGLVLLFLVPLIYRSARR